MPDLDDAVQLISSENRDERLDGEIMIRMHNDQVAARLKLFEMLEMSDYHFIVACSILYDIGSREDTDQLIQYLSSGSEAIVRSTIRTIGRIGGSTIVEPLEGLWNSTDSYDTEIRFALWDLCDRMRNEELESFRSTNFKLLKILVEEQFTRQHRNE